MIIIPGRPLEPCTIHLPSSAERLTAFTRRLVLTIVGLGVATLEELFLYMVQLREWPCLPSLCVLALFAATRAPQRWYLLMLILDSQTKSYVSR